MLGNVLQFPDIVPFCENMANCGKVVVVAALDGTFQRKPFGTILELIPMVTLYLRYVFKRVRLKQLLN